MIDLKSTPNANYLESAIKSGLSAKAAMVYVVLLEAGSPLAPKNLVSRSGLHRQYVYDGIRELQDRGLIVSVGQKRLIRYEAASPDKLLREAEKQRIDALEGVRNLMRLYDRSPAGVVEIIRGSQAV